MNQIIIKHFINKLTLKDITNYCKNQNINLNDKELDYIYKIIKTNWYTIIYKNPIQIFKKLKENINPNEYIKIEKLFIESKNKYKNYL